MKKLQIGIVLIVLLFTISCKKSDNEDPNLSLQDLKLESSIGGGGYIQKDNWVLSDCNNCIQVRDYSNLLSPGSCQGTPVTFPPLGSTCIYSESGDTIVMWDNGNNGDSSFCYLLNISDPQNIEYICSMTVQTTNYPFAIRGKYLYQCANGSVLSIYKLTKQDSLNPNSASVIIPVSTTTIPGFYLNMTGAFYNNFIYLGGSGDKIYAMNISDPYHPTFEGQMLVQYNVGFQIYNNYLFAFGNHEFTIFDLTEPSHPKPVKRYEYQFDEQGFGIKGNYLYLGYKFLTVYDISNPLELKLVRKIDIESNEIQHFYFYSEYIYASTINRSFSMPTYNFLKFSGNKY